MDLNQLFANQIIQLKQCYADLGYAPQRLQKALQFAIEQEVEKTFQEVQNAKNEILKIQKQCQDYKKVLNFTSNLKQSYNSNISYSHDIKISLDIMNIL